MSEPKIIWYNSPEAVDAAHWGLSVEELSEGTFGVMDLATGNEHETPSAEVYEAMREQGFWGFADPTTETVHVWASPDADTADVAYMLGHELGHMQDGSECTQEEYVEDHKAHAKEEERADVYGGIAATVTRWLAERKP